MIKAKQKNDKENGQPKEEIRTAIEALTELKADIMVPKNIKNRIDEIISALSNPEEMPIKINKTLDELDEISEDNNIQPYTRTQIWNIVSLLESIHS